MIQRIQTIYLLGAIVLMALCFYVPIAELTTAEGELYRFTMKGYYMIQENSVQLIQPITSLVVSGLLLIGLLVVTIFLYKARRLQMRLSVYSIILLLGLNFIYIYIIISVKNNLGAAVLYRISVLFPFISAILVYLAFRGIKKDEDMVKSYDRIR